jgi:aspartokinase-like uncharacterized kinase
MPLLQGCKRIRLVAAYSFLLEVAQGNLQAREFAWRCNGSPARTREMSRAPIVIKVGGSLFDLPDLGQRLHAWLAAQGHAHMLLVPGGGPTAEVIRALDRRYRLGEEAAHWLALRAVALNASILAAVLPGGRLRVVSGRVGCESLWSRLLLPVLDAHAFAQADDGQPACLPHCWEVTSDSLAARAAVVFGASELILLKSTSLPAGTSWKEAGEQGFVDPYFSRIADSVACIRAVNLRDWSAPPGRPSSRPADVPQLG